MAPLSLEELLGRMASLSVSTGRVLRESPQTNGDHEYALNLVFEGRIWRAHASVEPEQKEWSRR